MNDELKPCPSCSGKPNISMTHECDNFGCHFIYEIVCPDCGYSGGCFLTKKDAVKVWNE